MLSAERLERILGCPCGWRGGPVRCEAPTRNGAQPEALPRWCSPQMSGQGTQPRERGPESVQTFCTVSRAAPAAPLARRQRRAQRWGRPPAARRATPSRTHKDQGRSHRTQAAAAHSRLPRTQLSSSRPPRQGRPAGRRWRDRHAPTLDPAATHKNYGAHEGDDVDWDGQTALGPAETGSLAVASCLGRERTRPMPLPASMQLLVERFAERLTTTVEQPAPSTSRFR